MPNFEIVVKSDSGLQDTLFREYESEAKAIEALSRKIIDPNSGVEVSYTIISINQLDDNYFEAKTESDNQRKIERIENAKETGDYSELSIEDIGFAASNIIITTSYLVAGRQIENEIDVITAECVFGMNIFRDFFAAVRDLVGGRSAASQKVLRDARKTALAELRREALMVGADAVIAIDLDYQELSGGGKSGMLMIVASGTAVRLKAGEN